MSLSSKKKLLAGSVLVLGLGFIFHASYIQLKAQLAQVLIASAYAKQSEYPDQKPVEPWPWADTRVVAKLEISGKIDYILANASMRNLAFGPAHMPQSAALGSQGNSVIIGHRDTHFSHLQNIEIGETIRLYQGNKLSIYKVEEMMVVNEDDVEVLSDLPMSALTLITCYPFNGLNPKPKQRFVLRAIKVENVISSLL